MILKIDIKGNLGSESLQGRTRIQILVNPIPDPDTVPCKPIPDPDSDSCQSYAESGSRSLQMLYRILKPGVQDVCPTTVSTELEYWGIQVRTGLFIINNSYSFRLILLENIN